MMVDFQFEIEIEKFSKEFFWKSFLLSQQALLVDFERLMKIIKLS